MTLNRFVIDLFIKDFMDIKKNHLDNLKILHAMHTSHIHTIDIMVQAYPERTSIQEYTLGKTHIKKVLLVVKPLRSRV